MKTWSKILGLMLAIALLSPVFNTSFAQDDNSEKLTILTTTTQAYDATRIIAQDKIEVLPLMGAGVDPHLYKATEADIALMNSADAIFYSGLHLEGQLGEVFEALGERNIRTYAISDAVYDAGLVLEWIPVSETQGTSDPHFWFDPRNWQVTVAGIADILSEIDPDNAEFYSDNAEAYIEQLQLLYEWGLEALSQVPEAQRVLVTSHDAFQYFGDAFDWEVRGLQGISTQSEAGVADIQDIADFVVENQIPVMFVESSVPPNTIEAVQSAVLSQGFNVEIGVRVLYSDAMDAPDTFGGTYVGMIATNVITILQSYGYEIPEWPEDLEPVPPVEPLTLSLNEAEEAPTE